MIGRATLGALGLLAWVGAAHAADTVVYAGGDPKGVIARVAASAEVAPDTLVATTLPALLAGRAPVVTGGATLRPCTGTPATLAQVRRSVDLASGAVAYMEYGSARAALDAAVRDLGCLSEPLDAALAARAWFLLGVVAHASSDLPASRAAFRQARVLAPDLAWDPNFAPAARGTFDAVAAEAAGTLALTFVPAPPTGAATLDGRPLDAAARTVGAGAHLLQTGDPTRTTQVLDVTDAAQVVVPAWVPADAVAWAGDGERRAALSTLLADALGQDGVAYVATGDVVWRVRLRGGTWDLLQARGTTGAASASLGGGATDKSRPHPARTIGGVTLGVGGAALVGGGIVAALGYADARAAVEDANVGDYDEKKADYTAAGSRYEAGLVVGSIGAALAATGLVLTVAF